MPTWSNVDATYNGYSGYSVSGTAITDGADQVGTLWAVLFNKSGNNNVFVHVAMDAGYDYTFRTVAFTQNSITTTYTTSDVTNTQTGTLQGIPASVSTNYANSYIITLNNSAALTYSTGSTVQIGLAQDNLYKLAVAGSASVDNDLNVKEKLYSNDLTTTTLLVKGSATVNGNITGSVISTTNCLSIGELASAPSTPADGAGGKLYTKADGKLYYISNEISEQEVGAATGSLATTDLTDGSNIVLKTGTQTLSGAKTFTSAIVASAGVSGNITGNAASSNTLATPRTIGGVSFDGSANINLPGVNATGNQDTSGNSASATALATARTIGGVAFDGSANINLAGVNASGNQNTSGNAATATILQTGRTIGGVSFNGSANINLPGVNTQGNQNTTGSAATLTTARTIGGVAFDGSANINLPGVNQAGNQDTTGNAATATSATTAGTVTTAAQPNITSVGNLTALNINGAFSLPTSDGTANQVIKTDGSGSLSWTALSSSQWTTAGTEVKYTAGKTVVDSLKIKDAADGINITATGSGSAPQGYSDIVVQYTGAVSGNYLVDSKGNHNATVNGGAHITGTDATHGAFVTINSFNRYYVLSNLQNSVTAGKYMMSFVWRPSSVGTAYQAMIGNYNNGINNTAYQAMHSGPGYHLTKKGGTAYNLTGSGLSNGTWTVVTYVWTGTHMQVFEGTTQIGSNSAQTGITMSNDWYIGKQSDHNSGAVGDIASLLIINNVVPIADAVALHTYTGGGAGAIDSMKVTLVNSGSNVDALVVKNDGEISFKNFKFPAADGSANQVLETDGSGTLSWATVASGTANVSTTTTNANHHVAFTSGTSGAQNVNVDTTLLFNPSTDTLAATNLTVSGNLTGTASSATALATARTIGGVSFDGTANINLPGVNATGNQDTTGSAATLTTSRSIGGVSFDGSANINLPGVNVTGNQDTSGNAATVTNGVYTTGNQTIAGTKTFSSTISGAIDGNAQSLSVATSAYNSSQYPAFISGTTTIVLTVTAAGGKYYIDGTVNPILELSEGSTYKFDLSNASNNNHPLKFSITSDGTHNSGSEYTTGVTTNGTAGSSGAWVQIVINASSPTLYYYCGNHSGMGNQINTPPQFKYNSNLYYNPSTNTLSVANLNVTGTTTTVDSTTVTVADPILQLGTNSSDDNLDRGLVLLYNSSGAKKAFMGYDDSDGKFAMLTDATDTGNVFTGTKATLKANLEGSANTLTTARTIGGVSFDGSANINLPGVNAVGNQDTTGSAATLTTARNIGGVAFDGSANVDLPGVNAVGNQNTTGSAATLTTARTIGGVSFDGSANVDLPGVNAVGNQNTTGSAATLTTARTIGGVSFDGSANVDLPGVNAAGNQDTTGNAATASTAATVTGSTQSAIQQLPGVIGIGTSGNTITINGNLSVSGSNVTAAGVVSLWAEPWKLSTSSLYSTIFSAASATGSDYYHGILLESTGIYTNVKIRTSNNLSAHTFTVTVAVHPAASGPQPNTSAAFSGTVTINNSGNNQQDTIFTVPLSSPTEITRDTIYYIKVSWTANNGSATFGLQGSNLVGDASSNKMVWKKPSGGSLLADTAGAFWFALYGNQIQSPTGSGVFLTGNQTIAGVKTFTGTISVNGAWNIPNTDGTANQVITTDGSGNVTWASVPGGSVTASTANSDHYPSFVSALTGSPATNVNSAFKFNPSTGLVTIPKLSATTMTGSIIPDTNDSYDIGSADKKIRDLYVSDSSMWVGDLHKIGITGGKVRLRKISRSAIPKRLRSAGGLGLNITNTHLNAWSAGKNFATMTLSNWDAFAKQSSDLAAQSITSAADVFQGDDDDDFDNDEVWDLNGTAAYYNDGNVGIGTNTPDFPLHVYAGSSSKGIRVDCESTDTEVLRFTPNDSAATTNGGAIRFLSSGSGNSDAFVVTMDGQSGGASKVDALTILQDGTLSFKNFTFPLADGTANQVLKTDGSGALSWTAMSGGGGSSQWTTSGSDIKYTTGITVVDSLKIKDQNDGAVVTPVMSSSGGWTLEAGAGSLNGTGGAQGTITASDEYNANYVATKLMDNSVAATDIWASSSTTPPMWIKYTFPSSKTIGRYRLWARNGYATSESPKDWQLRGVASGVTYDLNNASTYTVLDTKSGITNWTQPPTTALTNMTDYQEGIISSPGDYLTYVLHITGTNGARPQLSQIALYSYQNKSVEGVKVTLKNSGSDVDALVVKNDGEVSFKNFTFPAADGSANQVLKTDGSGALSWTAMSGGGGSSQWTTAGSNIHFATGDVGVGTTSPTSTLHVSTGSGTDGILVDVKSGDTTSYTDVLKMNYTPSVPSAYSDVVIHYKGNVSGNDIVDSKGNHNATVSGGAHVTGTDSTYGDYFSVGDASGVQRWYSMGTTVGNSLTASKWMISVKWRPKAAGEQYAPIISNLTSSQGFWFGVHLNGYHWNINGTNTVPSSSMTTGYSLQNNVWTTITWEWTGTQMKVYQGTTLVGSMTPSSTPTFNNQWMISSSPQYGYSGGYSANGDIASLLVLNNTVPIADVESLHLFGAASVSSNTSLSYKGGTGAAPGELKIVANNNGTSVDALKIRNDGVISFKSFTFPLADGTANQVLKTDGSGALSWTAMSGGGGSSQWTTSGSDIKYTTGITVVDSLKIKDQNDGAVVTPVMSSSGGWTLEAGAGSLNGTGGAQGTITESDHYGAYDATRLVDNSVAAAGWESLSTTPPMWVKYTFPTSKTIGRYRLWARNGYAGSAPKDWQLRGVASGVTYDLNNASTYTVLDTKSSITNWANTPSTALTNMTDYQEGIISSPGNYLTYVIHITGTNGSSRTQLSEIALYSYQDKSVEGVKVTLKNSGSDVDALVVKNDGEISFKNFTFPVADGTANQVLKTDGSGALSWTAMSGGGGGSSQWTTTGSDIKYTAGKTIVDSLKIKDAADGINITPVMGSATYTLEAGAGSLNGTGGSQGTLASTSDYASGGFIVTDLMNNGMAQADAWFSLDIGTSPYASPPEVSFEFPSAKAISMYRMWARTWGNDRRWRPTKWTLRGVLDGVTYNASNASTYTLLETVTSADLPQTGTNSISTMQHYEEHAFTNSTAFKKYVWRFTEGTNPNHVGIGEMALYSASSQSVESMKVTLVNSSSNVDVLVLKNDGEVSFRNFKFPLADGSANQVLETNGSGVLSWVNQSGGGGGGSWNGQYGGNTYPSITGTNGQLLTTNGSGTLSWTTVSGGDPTTAATVKAALVTNTNAGYASYYLSQYNGTWTQPVTAATVKAALGTSTNAVYQYHYLSQHNGQWTTPVTTATVRSALGTSTNATYATQYLSKHNGAWTSPVSTASVRAVLGTSTNNTYQYHYLSKHNGTWTTPVTTATVRSALGTSTNAVYATQYLSKYNGQWTSPVSATTVKAALGATQSTATYDNYYLNQRGNWYNAGASDSRIKKEASDLNDGDALATLRLLSPKKYKYIDPDRGTEEVYGFMAQEVKTVVPYAVNVGEDAIPDILETCAITNSILITGTAGSLITLTTAVTTNLENKSVRLTDALGNVIKEQVLQIVDSKRFVIEKTFDSTEIPDGTIKVFGTYIADFHSIRKDHLWTIATAATQELDRKVTTLENTISAQQSAIASLQAAVASLQNGN